MGADALQANSNQSGLAEDSSKIKTEYINFDFGTTQKLKSVDNANQTVQGIQAADVDQQAILVSDEIVVPVEGITPFLAVGSRLIQELAEKESDDIQLQIRSSTDYQQWSEWMTVHRDEHLTIHQDTVVGRLQYLPKNTRSIQFRVVIDDAGSSSLLRSMRLSFTSPGATSAETLQALEETASQQPRHNKSEIEDYPMPDYATRSDWDCPDGQDPSGSVSRTDVTHQIVHHTAGTNSSSDWPAVVRSIWDYHVNTNGWSDIGYNWLIDPIGVIYQGRGWINGDDEVQGAHFCGTNSNTMGVALLGNFEETSPSLEALGNLEELLAWKSDEKNIDPSAREYHSSSGLNLHTISGHRDGCSTLCPGENLYVRLPEVRENVDAKVGEAADTEGELVLESNYPNPFSESTTINFSLEKAGNVQITIWDIAGRKVNEVTDQFYEADSHSESWNASGYASGVYFCRLEFEDQAIIQKMVLLK
ncbi:N-acetylmuramoyl-L-alanine amidase [Aliifodinibius salipaludis]|nr:N-acetylmuramoyl-L-alanine amidase [Aliifodinibius salipaludis]